MEFLPEDYALYFEKDFRHRWIRPYVLRHKLDKYQSNPALRFTEIGKSVEGRGITMVEWGHGPAKILLWSQMHGNEPTATMAVIDLLNFLTSTDKYDNLRSQLSDRLSVTIIPMLNPDGSERFSRLNALGVDLNRDALAQRMPETQAFMKLVKEWGPHWAFNLHDQRNIFSAGDTDLPATISFLAASADASRKMTDTRKKSMQLISLMAKVAQEIVPGHIGRYTDEFYPRAFGDYFHSINIPCVLIESGAYPYDEFRDQARKLNFLCMLKAFSAIYSDNYDQGSVSDYNQIPDNRTNFYDLVLRNCSLELSGKSFRADVGLMYREQIAGESFEKHLLLKEVGDLRFNYGLREEKGGAIAVDDEALRFEQPANFEVVRSKLPNLKFKNGKIYEER